MFADQYLHLASLFVSYFVKVAAAYLICLLLGKMLSRPGQRFTAWMAFLIGSAAYWLVLLFGWTRNFLAEQKGARIPLENPGHTPASFQHVLVATSWKHAVFAGGRVGISIYLSGLVLLVSTAVWKRVRLHMLLARGRQAAPELQALFAELCKDFGIRGCELMVLDKLRSPATVYWWRPRILLPLICEQLDTIEQVADVLSHEMAHISRRDYFWASINELFCGLLFFHPAAWQARKHMRVERELACDLAVIISRPEHRADYADTLTQFARLCQPGERSSMGMDFASSASLLSLRVHAILKEQPRSSWAAQMFRATSFAFLLASYGLLAPAMAVVMEFAHPQPPVSSHLLPASSPIHRSAHPMGSARKPQASAKQQDEAQMINTPTAYRMQTVPGQPLAMYKAATTKAASAFELPATDVGDGGWSESTPVLRSPKVSVTGIIAATVGAIAGGDGDKDDKVSHRKSAH
jgi:beta-lactamase regulating signal transducer with metallopeptidase domain